jgi:hypothetical protein
MGKCRRARERLQDLPDRFLNNLKSRWKEVHEWGKSKIFVLEQAINIDILSLLYS